MHMDALVDRFLTSLAPETLSAAEQGRMGRIREGFHTAVRSLREKYDVTLGYPQSELRDANRQPEHTAPANEYQRMTLLNTVKGGADGTTPMNSRSKALSEYQSVASPKDMLTVIAGLSENLNDAKAGTRPATEPKQAGVLAGSALAALSEKLVAPAAWQTEVKGHNLDPDKLNADSLAKAMAFGVRAQSQVTEIMEKVSAERPETREVMATSLGKVIFDRLGTHFEAQGRVAAVLSMSRVGTREQSLDLLSAAMVESPLKARSGFSEAIRVGHTHLSENTLETMPPEVQMAALEELHKLLETGTEELDLETMNTLAGNLTAACLSADGQFGVELLSMLTSVAAKNPELLGRVLQGLRQAREQLDEENADKNSPAYQNAVSFEGEVSKAFYSANSNK